MSGPGWSTVRIHEVDPVAVAGVNWHPLRRTLGVEAIALDPRCAEWAAGEATLASVRDRLP